jgi:uncharacterized protein YbbC (DUF1343 family)
MLLTFMNNPIKLALLALMLCSQACTGASRQNGTKTGETAQTDPKSRDQRAIEENQARQDRALGTKTVDERPIHPAPVAVLRTGAEQTDKYLPLLKGKRVGLLVNHTSMVGQTHLVDALIENNITIAKIFSPEHGFRGTADAGESVKSGVDASTGTPIVSLYGANKAPTNAQMAGLDIVVFDIQDVGARFYTYISSMHYMMQACADNNIPLLIMDRPNPNGHYIDGPVLQMEQTSFVGMHPIPVVHGLTVAELAQMINGEGWLKGGKQCKLQIIQMENYTHSTPYSLPVKPSPNLPNDQAIALYPSLCFFEGTPISVGRGTPFPFQVVGAPDPAYGKFTFTPVSTPDGAKNPMFENKVCYGVDLRKANVQGLTLQYLIDFYQKSPDKSKFFNNFFNKLAGNSTLQEQIKQGMSEAEIRKTWEPALSQYKEKRKTYLLYKE